MIFLSLLISFALTIAIELPIAYWQKIPLKTAFSANLITNPIVVLVYHWASHLGIDIIPVVAVLEVGAIVAEGFVYKEKHAHPFIFSALVNAFSFGIGLLF